MLVNLTDILKIAEKNQFAVGAFNTPNLEGIETVIDAAEKLSEGDVSDVIEVDGVGYYVIRLDADHDEDASKTKRESLQTEAFNKLMDGWKEEITWKVNDKAWDKVKFDSLFKAPEEATEETEAE